MRRRLTGRNFNIIGMAGAATAALSAVGLAFLSGPMSAPLLVVFALSLAVALCVGLVRASEWYVGFLSQRGVGPIRFSWLIQIAALIGLGLTVDYFFEGVIAFVGAAAWATSFALLFLRLAWTAYIVQVRAVNREPTIPPRYRIYVLLGAAVVCTVGVALHHWYPLPYDVHRYVIAAGGFFALLTALTLLPELTAWRGYGLMLEWRVNRWRLRRLRQKSNSRQQQSSGGGF